MLKHFKNQPINKIQEHFDSKGKFTLCKFQREEIIKVIKELPKNRVTRNGKDSLETRAVLIKISMLC